MVHFVIVGILVIVVSVLTYFGVNIMWVLPAEASAQSIPIDWLWDVQMMVFSFLFSLIVVPMFYSLIVFRRKKGETGDGEHFEGNYKLEIAWTIIPLFAVVAMAYIGAGNLAEVRRADPDATVVKVTGRQWSWNFEYPEYGVSSNELHLAVGKQVVLQMTSTDVIHSFWVPEFRVKQDLVPGRITELRITPIEPGTYKVSCAELCGTSHAFMVSDVFVEDQSGFDTWMAGQVAIAAEASQTPEGRGKALVAASGCAACHSIDGSAGIGPTWLGIAGEPVELSGGTTIIADDAYLAESIKSPQAKIVAGFEAQQMIAFSFTDEQIADIVAYIKTLK